ncbi:Protein turtle [Armadillidium nasatum]|uniref:Protein turtle n=1 Tax=Armadillidium nasatum TaxID=96803 RepID=A0A5N5TPQ2_9CRUS|nr:Protein turtle [Armadillidium nasatum]
MDPRRGACPSTATLYTPNKNMDKLNDATTVLVRLILRYFGFFLCLFLPLASCSQYGDAEHITAILGESVVLNCPVSQPETPYIIQWKRQHHKIPIYIWYDGYDPHVEDNYKGRASRVNPNTNYGLASLNLTSVKENDQGWYECNVFYLDRTGATDNGTWIHLDVHAPPRFVTTPDDVTYVNIGDSIILNCEAEGTPTPEIMWFRDDKPVTPSDSVGIFNDGTELRINKIRDQDIGDYLCVARNAEGRVVHDAKVVIAGGAVIVNPPHNLTRLEGEKADFPCEAKALPGNVTVVWKRENVPIDQLSWLDTRSIVRKDGTLRDGQNLPRDRTEIHGGNLTIKSLRKGDHGFYECEVKNEIMDIVAPTQLLVEGTTPHPPYNISTETTPFGVKLSWLPGYPGGRDYDQKYRTLGSNTWSQIDVKPAGSTTVSIHNLSPQSTYEFQVQGKNELGDGMFSDIVTATTKEYDYELNILPTDSSGQTYFPIIINPKGPKPDPPTNLNVKRVKDGFLITWDAPEDSPVPVQYYDIEYKIDTGWKKLNKENIVGETSYKVKKFKSDTLYAFRVLAKTVTSFDVSEEFKFQVPVISKERLIIWWPAELAIIAMEDSPQVQFRLLWTRISGLNWLRKKFQILFDRKRSRDDTIDSRRPLHSSFEIQERSQLQNQTDEGNEDPNMSAGLFDSYGKSVGSIQRTMEGKFVLDKDSEEGGFTSPRKPIRSLVKRRSSVLPYTIQPNSFVKWVNRGRDRYYNRFVAIPTTIEGGVYDVRAGTALQVTPRVTFSTEDPVGDSPYGHRIPSNLWRAQYVVQSPTSPEFGHHVIPESPNSTLPLLKQRRIRSSSPRPYIDEWNQLAQLASFNDEMSSVRQPSSVERSFPSTVFSSFQNSSQKTPSMHGTPLNAASLLQDSVNMEYNRVIQEQERLLQQNKLLMRQQELQRLAYTPQRVRYKISQPQDNQVHASYPRPYFPRGSGNMYYSGHFTSWPTPYRQALVGQAYRAPHAHFRSPRSSLFHPPYREPIVILPNSYSVPHHYVNVPPRQGHVYQRILGEDPSYYLLKPSSETPKPLATSSPPRSRVQPQHSHIHMHTPRYPRYYVEPDININPSLLVHPETLGESDISIDQPVTYTRDRLQRAIGRVRSGGLKSIVRPHSAPNLSSAGRNSGSIYIESKKSDKKGETSLGPEDTYEKSEEISHEQSPNSSSGFGSKNTSQQQSSSQSGHSISALGLDTSRIEASESDKKVTETSRLDRSRLYLPSSKQSLPSQVPSYGQWLPRQVLPQFRLPLYHPSVESSLLVETRNANAPQLYQPSLPQHRTHFPISAAAPSPLYQNVLRTPKQIKLRRPDKTQVLSIGTDPAIVSNYPFHIHSTGFTHLPNLDLSVDDHYEFDTLLSPTPGVEDSNSFWSRSRSLSGERGLSDSEIYGSGGKRKEAQESMEARVAAMKQEFHEYRQRQAKRRSSRELEILLLN